MRDSKRRKRRPRILGIGGVDYVRCRICGDHRRVLSGRHLSKHEITRDEYMREYRFSPDQLIASNSRTLHTSRPNFRPFNKRTWIAAIRKRQQKDGKLRAGCLQRESPALYTQGRWLFGSWDKALRAAGFQPEVVRAQHVWTAKTVAQEIRQLRALGGQLNARL